MKAQIHHFFDPLCGWCWGFSQTFLNFKKAHETEFDWQSITGGMIVGDRVKPAHHLKEFIHTHAPRVTELTQAEFSPLYMENLLSSDAPLSSYEPSLVFHVLLSKTPNQGAEIAHAIHALIHIDGVAPTDFERYIPLALSYGFSQAEFLEAVHSDSTRQAFEQNVKQSQEWGVRGFPAVVVQHGEQYDLIANGFCDLETLNARLEKVRASLV